MGKVGYFEIQVDDFERAQKFYRNVFAWQFAKIDAPFDYYSIDTGNHDQDSIQGGMLKRQQPLAKSNGASGYVCAIYIDSIDDTLEQVKKNGGTVTMEKTPLPGMGYFAYGLDPEGNAFGLWETQS